MEYEILTGENESILQMQVERAIRDGWAIHGHTYVRRDCWSGKDILGQAMIKDNDNE